MATAPQSTNLPDTVELAAWSGVNQSSYRTVIDDQECWWMENLFPVAPGWLRSGWGPSPPIYTAPFGVKIARIFFTNIDGRNPLGFMFLDNGDIDQVNLNTGAVVHLGHAWTPDQPPFYPADLKLWVPSQFGAGPGQQGGVVIGSPLGLFAWDGATLYAPGDAPPLWLTGGATQDANGDPLVMPTGLPGIYAMEVYKERLWVMGQTVIAFSGPNNGAVFDAADGGGAFPYHGDQLTMTYTDLHQMAGSIYFFGDSMINVVTDLSLVSGAATQGPVGTIVRWSAQFNVQSMDPQVGQRFMRPVGIWEQAATLWNGSGIYLLSGSQTTWASAKLTNLMATLNFSQFLPTMAPAHIFGLKWMLFLGDFLDPFGVQRPIILCWSGPQSNVWVMASQHLNLTNIGAYEQNSVITPYGTDGNVLVQLFAQPDPTLLKRLDSKMYFGNQSFSSSLAIKDWKRIYVELTDGLRSGGAGTALTGSFTTAGGGIPNGTQEVSFNVGPFEFNCVPYPIAGKGLYGALTLTSISPDFAISKISLTFEQRMLFGA